MAKEKDELPSGDKSHENNVRVTIDNVIGGKTKMRKAKKTQDEVRKENFCKAISSIELTIVRDSCLLDFDMDFDSYNTPYTDAIDSLFKMLFNSNQMSFIEFYLYDRFNLDGELVMLQLPDGTDVLLNTPSDLYDFITRYGK